MFHPYQQNPQALKQNLWKLYFFKWNGFSSNRISSIHPP